MLIRCYFKVWCRNRAQKIVTSSFCRKLTSCTSRAKMEHGEYCLLGNEEQTWGKMRPLLFHFEGKSWHLFPLHQNWNFHLKKFASALLSLCLSSVGVQKRSDFARSRRCVASRLPRAYDWITTVRIFGTTALPLMWNCLIKPKLQSGNAHRVMVLNWKTKYFLKCRTLSISGSSSRMRGQNGVGKPQIGVMSALIWALHSSVFIKRKSLIQKASPQFTC